MLTKGSEGEAFEKFHFDHAVSKTIPNEASTCRQGHVNVVDPCVHVLDDEGRAACVAYVSSIQAIDSATGQPVTRRSSNTRLWVRNANGDWKNVHYHRGWTGTERFSTTLKRDSRIAEGWVGCFLPFDKNTSSRVIFFCVVGLTNT